MDIFNLTNNRLIEMDFEVIELEGIDGIGGVVYKSPYNYVVLKKAYTSEELKNITNYSSIIRHIMLENKLNINNTYLIICTNINIDYETFFIVERDTTALRKYVIRNGKDLNRVPFLDNSEHSKSNDFEVVYEIQQNNYLQIILNYIKENSGQHNKLNKQQIDYSIEMIMDLVGEEVED